MQDKKDLKNIYMMQFKIPINKKAIEKQQEQKSSGGFSGNEPNNIINIIAYGVIF
jgi:hypothetical protein